VDNCGSRISVSSQEALVGPAKGEGVRLSLPAAGGRTSDKRLLPINEVARQCGVSKRTVYRWIAADELPVHRIPGTGLRPILRIAQDDLDLWLDSHRHDPDIENAYRDRTFRLDGNRYMQPPPSKGRKMVLDSRRPPRPVCVAHGRRSA
jgi:excisionase family DNA binding protein